MIRMTVSPALARAGLCLAYLLLGCDVGSTIASAAATSETTLEVASAGSPVTSVNPGTAITLGATVVSAGTPVTPGTVTFCDLSLAKTCTGLAVIGTAQLTAAGKASIVVRLGPGSHSLEAAFAGTNSFAGSESAPGVLTVSGTPTRGTKLGFSNSATPTMTGLQPGGFVTGDFNSDGNLDMAIADGTNNLVAVFLGKGDGTFQAGVSYPVGNSPFGFAVADLNNDGKLDLITVDQSGFLVLLGNGDGSFHAGQEIPVVSLGVSINAIAVADMNNDGNLDVLLTFSGSGVTELCVLPGNGDGTFQAPTFSDLNMAGFGLEAGPMAIGDFNADGIPDVAVACGGFDTIDNLRILIGNGDGTLQSARPPASDNIFQPASSIVAGDFNSDGKLDLALTFVSNDDTGPGESSYYVFLGNGDGTFQSPVGSGLALNTNPASIQSADFNGDGIPDLAMLGPGGPMILLGNGDGTFQAPLTFPFQESALAVGDFNGDGIPDLAGPAVLLNSIPGGMPPSFTIGASPASLSLTPGSHGAVTLTVTPQYGFSGAISFACSGLPAGAACTFDPMAVALSAAAVTTTLTITAPTPTAMLPGRSNPLFPKLIPVLVLVIVWPRRWHRHLLVLLAISLAGLTFLSACGGSSSHPSGPSTVTVTATSGSIHQSVTVAVTVN